MFITRGFVEFSEAIKFKNPKIDLLKLLIKIRLCEFDSEILMESRDELLAIYSVIALFGGLKYEISGPCWPENIREFIAGFSGARLSFEGPFFASLIGCQVLECATILLSLILMSD